MTDATDNYFDRLFTEEGQREYQRQHRQWEAEQRKKWHAGRFRRDADRHDRRIPFETRLAVLERANEHCEQCGRFGVCLELHHVTYENAYGDELPEDLMALCRDCHAAEHGMRT